MDTAVARTASIPGLPGEAAPESASDSALPTRAHDGDTLSREFARERQATLLAIDRKDVALARLLSAVSAEALPADTGAVLVSRIRAEREGLARLHTQVVEGGTPAKVRTLAGQVRAHRTHQYLTALVIVRQAVRVHARASEYVDLVEPCSEVDTQNTSALALARSAGGLALSVRSQSPPWLIDQARADLTRAQRHLAVVEGYLAAAAAAATGATPAPTKGGHT